jgi:hypothetical protein
VRKQRSLLAGAAALQLAALCSAAVATQVRTPAFACDAGPYAVVLPKHYPTLHVIGKHKWADIDARTAGGTVSTTRRIEYIGMTADVLLTSAAPDAYRLLALDVSSRRWNIGPLSVGQNPWKSVKHRALDGASQDDTLEIIGTKDSALLVVRGGRIEKVSYRCPVANTK